MYSDERTAFTSPGMAIPKAYTIRPGSIDYGKDYEVQVAALLVLKCLRSSEDFWIAMNVDEAGDFDDIVLHRKTPGDAGITYLIQLKYQEKCKPIDERDILAPKGSFSIVKYLEGYASFDRDRSMSSMKNHLRKSRKLFLLSTNRAINKEFKYVSSVKQQPYLDIIRDSGEIYKFNYHHLQSQLNGHRPEFLDMFYLLTSQPYLKEVEALVKAAMRDFISPLVLPEEELTVVVENFIFFMIQWYNGKLNGHRPLTKADVLKKLVHLFLKPYMVDVQAIKGELSVAEDKINLWNEIVHNKDVTIIERADDEVIEFVKNTVYTAVSDRKDSLDYCTNSKPYGSTQEWLWKYNIPVIAFVNDVAIAKRLQRLVELSQGTVRLILFNRGDQSLADFKGTNLFFSLDDLEEKYQSWIMQLHVKLQGRSPPLAFKDIIGEDTKILKFVTAKDIIHILLGNFNVGSSLESLPSIFINMSLSRIWLDVKVIEEVKDDTFVINCCLSKFKQLIKYHRFKIRDDEISLWHSIRSDHAKYIIFEELRQFSLIESYVTSKFQTIHFLVLWDFDHFEWIRTHGAIGKIQSSRKTSEPITSQPLHLAQFVHQLASTKKVVISANPGMGKSILMTYVANNFCTDYWVLKLNLASYTEFFKHVKSLLKENSETEIISKFFNVFIQQKCRDSLSQHIFQKYCQSKKILLLLDAFDEVPLNCQNAAKRLIEILSQNKFIVCVTTRPILKSLLESELNTFALTVNLFKKCDQEEFLQNYFSKHAAIAPRDERVVSFVTQLLKATKENLNDQDYEFTGVPLQCAMLAEVFTDDFDKFISFEKVVAKRFDLLHLYKSFIKRKLRIAFGKVEGISSDIIKQYKTCRYLYALRLIFPESDLEELDVGNTLKKMYELVPHMGQVIQKDGIVVFEDKLNVTFVHRSFAEYLAAKWLSKNVNSSYRCTVQKLIKLTFDPSLKVVRNIFDRFLAKRCPLLLAIINHQVDKVQEIVRSSDSTVLKQTDAGDRNVWHLVGSWGLHHPVHISNDKIPSLRIAATNDDMLKILKFLPYDKAASNTLDYFLNYTPLDYAVASRSFNVANAFCKNISNPHYFASFKGLGKEFLWEITDALQYTHFQRVSLQTYTSEGLNVYIGYINKDPNEMKDGLHKAIIKGNSNEISRSVSICNDINGFDEDGFTPLHVAAMLGDVETLKNLLHRGADPNKKDPNGRTALHLTCELSGRSILECLRNLDDNTCVDKTTTVNTTNAVEVLLKHNADIEAKDSTGNTPLILAVVNENADVVTKLLLHDSETETSNDYGNTALIVAASYGHVQVVNLLLSHGSNVNARNKYVNTALIVAANYGHTEVTKVLLQHGAALEARNCRGKTALVVAASYGHTEVVDALLSEGKRSGGRTEVDMDVAKDTDVNAALISAATNGHMEIVKSLLSQQFDKDNRSGHVDTTLIAAARNGHTRLACFLLDQGADKEAKNTTGDTALIAAATNGHLDAFNLLLYKNCDTEAKNNLGNTALIVAAIHQRPKIVQALLSHGADLEAKNCEGDTALISAAKRGHLEIVNLLLSRGSETESKNNDGDTALISAARRGHLDAVNVLLSCECAIDASNVDSDTALICAARRGYLDVVNTLLSHKCDMETKNVDGDTALISAAWSGHVEVARALLAQGCDVNADNNYEDTALMSAATKGHVEVVKLLLRHGPDVDAKNIYGETALILAESKGHVDVVSVLSAKIKCAKFF